MPVSASPSYASAPLYVGCLSSFPIGTFVGTQTDYTACASACETATGNYEYAYYDPVNQPCFCSDAAPPVADYTAASEAPQTDDAGAYFATCDTGSFPYYVTDTTYTVNPIYGMCQSALTVTPVTAGATTTVSQTVAGPEECFQFCEAYSDAYYTISAAGFACTCFSNSDVVNTVSHTTAGACDASSIYWFQHTAGQYVTDSSAPARPSEWVKRQAKERLARRALRVRDELCPGASTACKVPGIIGSYECMDTQTELESCGGCAHGSFSDASAMKGVDCTSLEGVVANAVTCSAGQCQATACQSGYTLAANGTCVA